MGAPSSMAEKRMKSDLYATQCPIFHSDGPESPILTEPHMSLGRASFELHEQKNRH